MLRNKAKAAKKHGKTNKQNNENINSSESYSDKEVTLEDNLWKDSFDRLLNDDNQRPLGTKNQLKKRNVRASFNNDSSIELSTPKKCKNKKSLFNVQNSVEKLKKIKGKTKKQRIIKKKTKNEIKKKNTQSSTPLKRKEPENKLIGCPFSPIEKPKLTIFSSLTESILAKWAFNSDYLKTNYADSLIKSNDNLLKNVQVKNFQAGLKDAVASSCSKTKSKNYQVSKDLFESYELSSPNSSTSVLSNMNPLSSTKNLEENDKQKPRQRNYRHSKSRFDVFSKLKKFSFHQQPCKYKSADISEQVENVLCNTSIQLINSIESNNSLEDFKNLKNLTLNPANFQKLTVNHRDQLESCGNNEKFLEPQEKILCTEESIKLIDDVVLDSKQDSANNLVDLVEISTNNHNYVKSILNEKTNLFQQHSSNSTELIQSLKSNSSLDDFMNFKNLTFHHTSDTNLERNSVNHKSLVEILTDQEENKLCNISNNNSLINAEIKAKSMLSNSLKDSKSIEHDTVKEKRKIESDHVQPEIKNQKLETDNLTQLSSHINKIVNHNSSNTIDLVESIADKNVYCTKQNSIENICNLTTNLSKEKIIEENSNNSIDTSKNTDKTNDNLSASFVINLSQVLKSNKVSFRNSRNRVDNCIQNTKILRSNKNKFINNVPKILSIDLTDSFETSSSKKNLNKPSDIINLETHIVRNSSSVIDKNLSSINETLKINNSKNNPILNAGKWRRTLINWKKNQPVVELNQTEGGDSSKTSYNLKKIKIVIDSTVPEEVIENESVNNSIEVELTKEENQLKKTLLLEPTDDESTNFTTCSLFNTFAKPKVQEILVSNKKEKCILVENQQHNFQKFIEIEEEYIDDLENYKYQETDCEQIYNNRYSEERKLNTSNRYNNNQTRYQHQLSVPLCGTRQLSGTAGIQNSSRRRRTSVIETGFERFSSSSAFTGSGDYHHKSRNLNHSLLLDEEEQTLLLCPSLDVSIRALLSPRDIVLRRCGQTDPYDFSVIYSSTELRQCRKIGEGVYGEVYMNKNRNGDAIVLKIIPIDGPIEINGEQQKNFEQILPEIIIAGELSRLRYDQNLMTSGFVEVKNVHCVQGRYPEHLIDLWELYRDNCGTENDHPEIFQDDQLYIVLELANGGQDLEAFQFQNALQSYSAFLQTALSLAVAESKFKFEHRDLHWGNILLATTDEKEVKFKIDDKIIKIPTHGVKATIIDYTLSRMNFEGCCLYNDLSNDNELFAATGDYQFDIYRLMQKSLENQWERYDPYTNILWLHYALDKMISGARYRYSKTKKHRSAIQDMMQLRDELLDYKSASDYVQCLD